ncbi:MAG TPA: ribbon-helix-helix domain-containing protein, partial [Candidatus Bathyarchaeia archaeon]|nr:ribbon-helix-helix domain-containing protein [Candidatus Bathyarchaeia archaeon]
MKSILQQRIARGKFIKSFGPQIRMGMSMPRSLHEALMKEAEERCYPGINELIREILRVYVQEMESDAAKPDSTYESLQKEAAERQFPGVNEFI